MRPATWSWWRNYRACEQSATDDVIDREKVRGSMAAHVEGLGGVDRAQGQGDATNLIGDEQLP